MMELICLGLLTGWELGGHRAGRSDGETPARGFCQKSRAASHGSPFLTFNISPKSLGTHRLGWETWDKHWMRDLAWQGDGVAAKPAAPPTLGKFHPSLFLFQLKHLSNAGGCAGTLPFARSVLESLSKGGRGI